MTFQIWFSQNKEQLKLEWPDKKPQEFSKCAVTKYKLLYGKDKDKDKLSNGNVVSNVSIKRKLEIEDSNDENNDSELKQSGISKLAKFGFKK